MPYPSLNQKLGTNYKRNSTKGYLTSSGQYSLTDDNVAEVDNVHFACFVILCTVSCTLRMSRPNQHTAGKRMAGVIEFERDGRKERNASQMH